MDPKLSPGLCIATKCSIVDLLGPLFYMSAKNLNLIVKNKHNDGLKNLNFEFLAVVGQFKLKKNVNFSFLNFYYLIPKNSLGFLI